MAGSATALGEVALPELPKLIGPRAPATEACKTSLLSRLREASWDNSSRAGGGCDGGTCGKIGQPCCGGDVDCTAPFSFCSGAAGDTCVPCGGLGQVACDSANGRYCAPPTVVTNDWPPLCVACGALGQPCCQGDVCQEGTCGAGNNTCQ